MKKTSRFCRDLQRFIAVTAIGPSALRNQGSKGVIKAARDYLTEIDLKSFRANTEKSFLRILDTKTEDLKQALPRKAKNWGAARKALNLFLRDIYYNRFLFDRTGLENLEEEWMEIPLDSLIAQALKRMGIRGELPRWPGLVKLTPEVCAAFQAFAKKVAAEQSISRIHLDMRLWTQEREK